jgi:hypothetical protein
VSLHCTAFPWLSLPYKRPCGIKDWAAAFFAFLFLCTVFLFLFRLRYAPLFGWFGNKRDGLVSFSLGGLQRFAFILPVQYSIFVLHKTYMQGIKVVRHEGNEQEEVKAVVRVVFPEQRWLHAREPLAVGTKSKHAEAKAVRKDPDEKNKLKDAGKWSCSACGLTLARKDNVQRPGFSLLSTLSEPYQHRTEAQQ